MGGPSALGWLTVIEDAVIRLSRHRIGAVLIVADSTTSLVDEGVILDARLSAALLVSLLVPEAINELSRGAIVVRDEVVERACVPVLRSAGWDWVGALAQELSAAVVAVSEDDGVIRVGNRQGATAVVPPASLARDLVDHVHVEPGETSDSLEPILDVLKRSFTMLRDLVTTGFEARRFGVQTGFEGYDRFTGGLHEREIVVFAGREGVRVNSFLLQIAANVAREAAGPPVGVLILSPHLTPKDMALRLMWSLSGIEQREDPLERSEWAKLSESAAALAAMPIWFDSSPSLTTSGLKDRIRRLRDRVGGDDESRIVVFIPDLVLFGPGDTLWGHGRSLQQTTTALRALVREVDVAVVAAVRILHGADHYAALAELRRLERTVDRMVILHPGWAENEVFVQLQGRLGNYGFRLHVTPGGGFKDTK